MSTLEFQPASLPATLRGRELCAGTAAALAIDWWTGGVISQSGQAGEAQLALVPVALLVLSVGLSILAGYLLKRNIKNPLQDERPTALATRGSYVAWFRGVRRLGYTMTWAGDRTTRKEKVEGGKGDVFSGPKQTVFVESAMHVVCVGPVKALLSIEQAGTVIFTGPITNVSHPSGTLVDLGGEGSFRIFWGEDDQPINNYLGDSTRQGVDSRWPNFCYIEWRGKRLGTQPMWPLMTYTMLQEPSGDYLSDTDPWMDETQNLTGTSYGSFVSVSAVNSTITLFGLHEADIRPLDRVRLTGNALSDRDLNIIDVETVTLTSGAPWYFTTGYQTTLEFEEDLTGIDTAGQIQLYVGEVDDGCNAAHAIADMLFAPHPLGLGLSQGAWDVDSLEDLGTLMVTEDLRTSFVAQDADTAQERLGAALQDLGVMVPIDVQTGKVKFFPLREPSGTLDHLDDLMIVDQLPELEKLVGQKPVDFMIFGFPDRENNFRDMTLGRAEDGQIGFYEHARARNIPITCTTHYDTAAQMANRREQEEFAQGSVWSITTNRGTREFLPGQAITSDFTTEVLRVLEAEPTTDSNEVKLKIMVDTYGIAASDFVDEAPPPTVGVTPVSQDLRFAMVEVPEYLDGVPPQTILIPRIRAHNQVDGSLLHLSADDTTYVQLGDTLIAQAGGLLTTALSADGYFEPADGTVQFTTLGPDISTVLDLSADTTNWRLGRQIAIILSTAGEEICFLKKVTVVSGDTYSLDGLIRARYDTQRLAHPADAVIYIVDALNFTASQNPLLLPEVVRYAKSQPTGKGVVSLASISPSVRTLYGKGIRPPAISGLRVTFPLLVNTYVTGSAISVEWDFPTPRTPGTSAGLVNAGTAIGTTTPEGNFLVEFLTTGDVLKRTENILVPYYTYSNANLVSDFGSEVDIKVRVTQLRDGYASDTREITVEKI
jgi:hypothetical protein